MKKTKKEKKEIIKSMDNFMLVEWAFDEHFDKETRLLMQKEIYRRLEEKK